MSDSKTPAAEDRTFDSVEFLVQGHEKATRAFVRGLFIGARSADWPVFNDEFGIRTEKWADALKEWVGITEPLSHFIARRSSVDLVSAALRDPRAQGLKLQSIRPIRSASFDFRFKVFTEERAAKVREVFTQLPKGVVLTGFSPREQHRADDTAEVELYSVVHDYEMEGGGAVSGDFRGVLYVHEQARRIEQIDESELILDLGDPLGQDP